MEKEISNEKELFANEEIIEVMQNFDEAVAMDELCCIIYCVAAKNGNVRSHVRGKKINAILCILSILENNNITIKDLEMFK